jgi:hypothetical protein
LGFCATGGIAVAARAASVSYSLGGIYVAAPLGEIPLLGNRGLCERTRECFFRIGAGMTWDNSKIAACGGRIALVVRLTHSTRCL